MSDHDDYGGLSRDLAAVLDRRRALQVLAGGSLLALVGCTSRSRQTPPAFPTSAATPKGTAAATTGACEEVPAETAGPYPGNGSIGPNVLDEPGVVRSDIRRSFGGASGIAEGVPLTMVLALQDPSCRPLDEAAVYLWHCDQAGRYSLYSEGVTGENYLRGLQPAKPDGTVAFRTIWPGCYPGRYPHLHFEVYASLADAASGSRPLATSQVALPSEACTAVYAQAGYAASRKGFAGTSLRSDGVFRDDGGTRQLAKVTGSPTAGYTARLTVPVSAS